MSSGQRCPKDCGGYLRVTNSERHGDRQVQYLACGKCGHRPPSNKIIKPADHIRRRSAVA